MMKLLFKFLKKLPAKWLVGLIAIVWVLGLGLAKLSVNQCIVITAIIVGIWAIYFLIAWLRARGRGEEAEMPPELTEIEERLVNAKRSEKDAPWYLLIGPEGCGKTVLLRNSNLDFSYIDSSQEKPIAQGIDATRNCDFFHTKQGIILDTTGRYVTYGKEAQNQTEWLGLLSLLKKHRSQKTIDGLIIAADIDRLLRGDEYEIGEEAKNIRERVEEVISQLGMTFPIYLVFTKCDLIYGFSEFFSGMSNTELPQIWGATLRIDQQDSSGTVFEEECKRLFHSLSVQRMLKLASDETQDSGAIYAFPLEFDATYQKLTDFVSGLFPSISAEKPIFRGFYFTSGTQADGTPVDFVLRRVAELEHQPSLPRNTQSGAAKSYFIKNIFQNIVFPDRGLDRPTAAEGRRNTVRRLTFCGIAAAVLAFLFITLTVTYSGNKKLMTRTEKASVSVDEARIYTDEVDRLERFERLRKLIVRLERFPVFSLPWYSQRKKVAASARRFYLSQRYGSDDGWNIKLRRTVEIPVRMYKSEADVLEAIEKAEIKAVAGGKNYTIVTNKDGATKLEAKVEDGRVNVVFSTSHTEEGYEPQPDQTYQIEPGEKSSPEGIRFVFSKLGRIITVHCVDQNGNDLPGVPVSIIEQTDELKKYGPENSNEQGIAQLRLEAPKDTTIIIYYGDSSENYQGDKPDYLTIQSGQSRYSLEKQLRRKLKLSIIALAKNKDETIQQAKSGVSVSVGGTKLGLTDNNGHWTGPADAVPTRQSVTANPSPDNITVEATASGYSIKLEYILPEEKTVTPDKPTQVVEPLPTIKLDSSVPTDIEVWMYVQEGDEEFFNSSDEIDRMEFRSDGQQVRLLRLDAKAGDAGGLELPKEAKDRQLQLWHPYYWPKKVQWKDTEQAIGMIAIDQERSLEDFDKKQRDGAEYYYKQAQKYQDEGNKKQAVSDYQNAVRLSPRLEYYLRLAWAYYENNQADAALRQVKIGLEFKLADDPAANKQLLIQQLEELLGMLE